MPPLLLALLWIIVAALIVGVLLWGLDRVPWIDANIKAFLRVVIICVFAIYVILAVANILAALFGSGPFLRFR
jgi:hypothetical protein